MYEFHRDSVDHLIRFLPFFSLRRMYNLILFTNKYYMLGLHSKMVILTFKFTGVRGFCHHDLMNSPVA